MSNTYGAHIFKQASVGEREEVKIKLFMPDGSPIGKLRLFARSDSSGNVSLNTMDYFKTWLGDQHERIQGSECGRECKRASRASAKGSEKSRNSEDRRLQRRAEIGSHD